MPANNIVFEVGENITETIREWEADIGNHKLVGYCCVADLTGFCLDPPRGQDFRVAFVLSTGADENEGLQIHKLEYIELDQMQETVLCMQKLRRLSKRVHYVSTETRSRSIELESQGMSPSATKKARTLQAAPSATSLPE